jgi:hypothetical protein
MKLENVIWEKLHIEAQLLILKITQGKYFIDDYKFFE